MQAWVLGKASNCLDERGVQSAKIRERAPFETGVGTIERILPRLMF